MRACTDEEAAVLDAAAAAERAEDEKLRGTWFAFLRDGVSATDEE